MIKKYITSIPNTTGISTLRKLTVLVNAVRQEDLKGLHLGGETKLFLFSYTCFSI